MAERGISADHATSHRWSVRYSPDLLEQFNRRKRVVTWVDGWLAVACCNDR